MSLKKTIKLLFAFFAIAVLPAHSQSLQHPVIFTTEAERAHILELIDSYSWASSVVSKTKSIVDGKVATHINNPAAILGTIPALASDDPLDNILKILPNPNKGVFTLKLDNYNSAQFIIYAMNGKEIKSGQFRTSTRIDISDNLSGVYILNVIDKQVSITKKLIVKP